MSIHRWNYTLLQPSDLHQKAQRFIEMMGIDTSNLKLIHLTPCPDGKFIKSFDELEERTQNNQWAAVAEFEAIYFFTDYTKVKIAIHELTHIYFSQSRIFNGINYDLRAMVVNFIEQHGIMALTDYAQFNLYEDEWEEVICEIVATYGRRGQFKKIKELFNLQTTSIKNGGI